MNTQTETQYQERLSSLAQAVYAADEAWYAVLDREHTPAEAKAAKATYTEAKAAYREVENEAIGRGMTSPCSRCGGAGGWQGWPDFTCYRCGGGCREAYRPLKFQTMPPTRIKNAARAAAKFAQERDDADTRWSTFAAEHPEEAAFMKASDDQFIKAMVATVEKWNGLTEKQLAAVQRNMVEAAEEARIEALRESGEGEWLSGKAVTIEGEVVKVKSQERGYHGWAWKMLVVSDDGNRYWGTAPESLWRAAGEGEEGTTKQIEGSTIRFIADTERSADDEHFGFFKRPRQLEVVSWANDKEGEYRHERDRGRTDARANRRADRPAHRCF